MSHHLDTPLAAWAVRVPINAPPLTPNQIVWLEDGLAAMAGTSLDPQEKMSVILLLSGFVRNWATLTADLTPAALATGGGEPDPAGGYGRALAGRIDPLRLPEVHKVIQSGVLDDEDGDFDKEFAFGLDRFLDGVESLMAARAAGE